MKYLAWPDVFDPRDFVYRPRLQLLPERVKPAIWPRARHQGAEQCVGYALAAMIDISLCWTANGPPRASLGSLWRRWHRFEDTRRVSPEMLHYLATRYDEWRGHRSGTSLRAGLKGWYHHGLCLHDRWKEGADRDRPEFIEHCQERPLGAYFRINPFRIDDLQSAITEAGAVVVSCMVPAAWADEPRPDTVYCWQNPTVHHALVLIGYDHKGFLALNSYGPDWGTDGTYQIYYADWLDNATDAWVARPGVPATPLATNRMRGGPSALVGPVAARVPDVKRLAHHVIYLNAEGEFSKHGHYVSSPQSPEAIRQELLESGRRDLLIWFHDGLTDDDRQRELSIELIDWWDDHDKGVYPLFVAWPALYLRRLFADLGPSLYKDLPGGLVTFDVRLQVDQRAELLARTLLKASWKESEDLPAHANGLVKLCDLVEGIVEDNPNSVRVHLVSVGTGSGYLLRMLQNPRLDVSTSTLLWPTSSHGRLGSAKKNRFAIFTLTDKAESEAGCLSSGQRIHSRSLLSLIEAAFARGDVLGLHPDEECERKECGGVEWVRSPTPPSNPQGKRSRAMKLEEFATDSETLQSIRRRIRPQPTPASIA